MLLFFHVLFNSGVASYLHRKFRGSAYLACQRPPENAVDMVFLSEGYTSKEKHKFLEDMGRFIQEEFGGGKNGAKNGLYYNFNPFFNLYSVFTASKVSGVGTEESPKDTAFKLFRETGKLRSILPDDDYSYPKALKICRAHAPACDIAVILVNDPFYGGLGDEVAILSASKSTGSIAFRHELGHILADIGEEYDGGEDYSGANYAESNRVCKTGEKPRKERLADGVERTIWPCISWNKWLSRPQKNKNTVDVQPSRMLLNKHPWSAFRSGADSFSWRDTFVSSGKPKFLRLELSAFGISGTGKIKVSIDGNLLGELTLPKDNDRHFFDFQTDKDVQFLHSKIEKEHSVVISLDSIVPGAIGKAYPRAAPPTLCHIVIWEFFDTYESEEGFVGAFPVYKEAGGKIVGYRPTDNTCLMREMQSKTLCPVCREAIWKNLFSRTRMIQSIQYSHQNNDVTLSLKTLPFGIKRKNQNVERDRQYNENIYVRWDKENTAGSVQSWGQKTCFP